MVVVVVIVLFPLSVVVFQLHQNEFNLNAALYELYGYASRYNDEVRHQAFEGITLIHFD